MSTGRPLASTVCPWKAGLHQGLVVVPIGLTQYQQIGIARMQGHRLLRKGIGDAELGPIDAGTNRSLAKLRGHAFDLPLLPLPEPALEKLGANFSAHIARDFRLPQQVQPRQAGVEVEREPCGNIDSFRATTVIVQVHQHALVAHRISPE